MKKGIAILLVLTLMLSLATPVFASAPSFGVDFTTDGTTGDVDGTGGYVVINDYDDVIHGYIPTAAALDFIIDPLGLLDMVTGGVTTINMQDRNNIVNFNHPILETDAGGAGDILFAYNMSSVPVLLTLNMSVEATNAAVITDPDDALLSDGETDTANIFVWMEPHAYVLNYTEGDLDIPDDLDWIGEVIAFDTGAGVYVRYRLEEVEHELVLLRITGDFPNYIAEVELQPVDGAAEMHGTAFRFGGVFNSFGTWISDRDIALSINVAFEMIPVAGDCAVFGIDADNIPFYQDGDVAYGLLGVFSTGVNHANQPLGITNAAPALVEMPEQRQNIQEVVAGWFFPPGGPTSGVTTVGITPLGGSTIWFTSPGTSFNNTGWVNFSSLGIHDIEVWVGSTSFTVRVNIVAP